MLSWSGKYGSLELIAQPALDFGHVNLSWLEWVIQSAAKILDLKS